MNYRYLVGLLYWGHNMDTEINMKYIEILSNLILEQNKQLLQIIAEEEKIGYKKIINFLPSQYDIKKHVKTLCNMSSS